MTVDLLAEVLDQEARIWAALVAGDAGADRAALHADFLGLYPDGYAGRNDHAGQLAQGPTVADYRIEAPRVLPLAADVVLLAYRAEYRRPGGAVWERMWVSSIWRREAAGWVNLFSQDTPCDTPFRPV
jgi:hypothetical protein